MDILIIPNAARLSAKGSLSPVGFLPKIKKPTKLSILSAMANRLPNSVTGRLPPTLLGKYCSFSAATTAGS